MKSRNLYYGDYLQLEKLLDAQHPISHAHDEMLFITIHQTYELWFKQIIFELRFSRDALIQKREGHHNYGPIIRKLERVCKILKILVDQIDIIETILPIDFLEFRDDLIPASGFQSLQFRTLEFLLGEMSSHQGCPLQHLRLNTNDLAQLKQQIKEPSLIYSINLWLEKMPFSYHHAPEFWKEYRQIVLKNFEKEQLLISKNKSISHARKQIELKIINKNIENFHAFFDNTPPNNHNLKQFSFDAILSVLFIFLYRDEEDLQQPFRLIQTLMDIEENLSIWRYRHMLMVQRMLGNKIGTGGTSGHEYLKKGLEHHKYFTELFNLATFLIPANHLPPYPETLRMQNGF
jgi:tryptophan 2,3-dioxygenase